MSLEEEFSMQQSEELIAQLKTSSLSGFTQLHSSLKLLSHVSELSPVAMPPILPSAVDQPIESITSRGPRAHRPAITSLIVTAVLASASFAAAGVTGRGPAVIVEAAQKSGEIVAKVVGTVGNTLTGNNNDSTPSTGSENDGPTTDSRVTSGPQSTGTTSQMERSTNATTTSDNQDESGNSVQSDNGDESHPTATPDASPTSTRPPSHGVGVRTLVLPPVTKSPSGDEIGESKDQSENHTSAPSTEHANKQKKSAESQSQPQTESTDSAANESD